VRDGLSDAACFDPQSERRIDANNFAV